MTREVRVEGPPGTGKSDHLARVIAATAEKYGGERLLVTSFTRAAARVLARRVELPADRVGTLHAHCFRALGRPTIAEGRVDEWNDRVGQDPKWTLSGGRTRQVDDSYALEDQDGPPGETGGDVHLAEANILRSQLVPVERWKAPVREWFEQWQGWLGDSGYVDFTGLLELALRDVDCAPGAPSVLFGDESQDWSPLEFALVRKWGARCDVGVYLAGDAAQAIYGFKGARPALFYDPPIPEEDYRFLRQSYRLPRAVLEVAEAWLRRSSDAAHYARRHFVPRRDGESGTLVEGEVRELQSHGLARVAGNFKNPEALVGHVAEHAERTCESWVILASCAYMLQHVIARLRTDGVAFHNPLRPAHGGWNPMRGGVDRLRDFLAGPRPDLVREECTETEQRLWTWQELERWTELVPTEGVLQHGARTAIAARVRDDDARKETTLVTPADLRAIFAPDVLEKLTSAFQTARPWEFLTVRLAEKKRAGMDFALNLVHRRGGRALREEPRIAVGTVHSYKGGEADNVLLFPDLSPSGWSEWTGTPEARDAVRRVFYVGMTRARKSLLLAGPATARAVEWGR